MKLIKMTSTKITNLYQLLTTTTRQEWKEHANTFFQEKVLRIKKTPEEIETIRDAKEEAKWQEKVLRIKKTPEEIETIRDAKEEAEWQEKLLYLLKDVDKEQTPIYKTLLNNQYQLKNLSDNFKLPTVSVVRQMLDHMTIKDLIGVQPMSGPVVLVYKLRYYEKDKKQSLEIVSQVVEAHSRKLQASWHVNATQGLNSQHGLDIESDLMTILATEVASEYNAEWINNISKIADEISIKVTDITEVLIAIQKAANDIKITTNRGAGNWIVVSPTMLAKIQKQSTGPVFEQSDAKEHMFSGNLTFVGMLYKKIKVYCKNGLPEDEILVGYKGQGREIDTGIIFAPYISLLSSGVVVNEETFQPQISLVTRYGVATDETSHNYYRKLKITYKETDNDNRQ